MKPEDLASIPPARLPFPVTRALSDAIECRAEGDSAMPTMVGHFSTFGDWYEVDSWIEGHFLESIKSGAFRKTIAESRDQMKVLYDHGHDPQIGNKVLGPIEDLQEDKTGPRYTVPLFDTSYNRDLRPGLEAGVYGSSFRFAVEKDQWDQSPAKSEYNPAGIPERTITEARVFEFGPVTFPANPAATAGVRSTTDTFYQRSRDPEAFETLLRTAQLARTPVGTGAAVQPVEPPADTQHAEPSRSDTPPAPSTNRSSKETAMEYITREEKAARVTELKASIEKLGLEYPGTMPAEAQSRWDAENHEYDELNRDIAAWDARVERIRSFAGADDEHVEPERTYSAPAVIKRKSDEDIYDIASIVRTSRTPEERHQRFRDNALRSVEQARFPQTGADQAGARAWVSNLIDYEDSENSEIAQRVLATGSPQYRRAFNRFVATGGSERGTALAVGVDGTGGFAVPYAFDPTIIAIGAHTTVNPFRTACRVETIAGTDTWRGLTSTAVTAAYATEAAAVAEGGPTFARPELIVKRAHGFVTASYEMAQDRPDLASELSVLFNEAKDTLEENKMAVGAASSTNPVGMFVDGQYTAVETIGNNVLAIADLYAIESALPIRYRSRAAWFMNRTVIHTVQGFETSGGVLFGGSNYAFAGTALQSPVGNTGLRLLGYPVYEVPSASALITTSAAIIGVFADPSSYVIVDRVGMSVKVIPDMLDGSTPSTPTGEIGIYAFWRNTAAVINADSGRQIKVNAP